MYDLINLLLVLSRYLLTWLNLADLLVPLLPPPENLEDLQEVVQERLAELLHVLKAVIGKHQTLNSADTLGAAGTVIAKVKGQ